MRTVAYRPTSVGGARTALANLYAAGEDMLIQQVALVSEFKGIDFAGLTRVSAAIQRQIARDLAPIWDISATISPFPTMEDVPAGYWPIIVKAAGLPGGDLGVHSDDTGQPMAYVEWSESWSITASHECMEMLVDPAGNRLVPSRSLDEKDDRVEYLVEVCDPCQHGDYAYPVNDTLVSDFYTPDYFNPTGRSGARYSMTGAIEKPRQILRGGYLSWHDPHSGDWWQADGTGQRKCLGPLPPSSGSLRERVDRMTPDHLGPTKLSGEEVQSRVGARRARAKSAANSRAQRLVARHL